jgi:protein-S-isoprenylcysteine O-methyltransferase Ste14
MRKVIEKFGNIGNVVILILFCAVATQLALSELVETDLHEISFLYANDTVRNVMLVSSVVLLLLGGAFATAARRALRDAFDDEGNVKTLVTTGPFRVVRHPFYLSMIVVCLSVFLLFSSYVLLIAFVLIFSLLVSEAKWEEEILIKQFGDEYRQYQKRTGMFGPKILKG